MQLPNSKRFINKRRFTSRQRSNDQAFSPRRGSGAPGRRSAGHTSTPPPTSATAVAAPFDVTAILDKLASQNQEKFDWKHSIVDMMKLVDMDSSIAARKVLTADLRHTGDTNDSATMNIWLHKEVMKKLAANGGKGPADLLGQ